jgi:tetraacyldisaccharide 4'-kinase
MRYLLIPFSYLYLLITKIRNKLYDNGKLHSEIFNTPIISVGNITTGGTGKTPLVVHIAKFYLERGLKVGILSRGYGRNSTFRMLVCDGNKILHPVDMTGDELYMISEELIQKYNNFNVLADNDRNAGCKYLIETFKPDVIILDDAFQKRSIKKDVDIAIIDAAKYETFFHKILLPSGDLRESMDELKRASIIIQNNKRNEIPLIPKLKDYGKPLINMSYKIEGIFDRNNEPIASLSKKIIAVAALASPESFFKTLERMDFDIVRKYVYSDHHNYIFKDIGDLKDRAEGGIPIITTHKDFVKFREYETFLKEYPVYYLKIGLKFDDNYNILEEMLLKAVKK